MTQKADLALTISSSRTVSALKFKTDMFLFYFGFYSALNNFLFEPSQSFGWANESLGTVCGGCEGGGGINHQTLVKYMYIYPSAECRHASF